LALIHCNAREPYNPFDFLVNSVILARVIDIDFVVYGLLFCTSNDTLSCSFRLRDNYCLDRSVLDLLAYWTTITEDICGIFAGNNVCNEDN